MGGNKMNYPKILIINCSFNYKEGSGILISNLFYNWPKDKIANASLDIFVDLEKCINYYQLNEGVFNISDNNENIKVPILDKNKKRNIFSQSLIGIKNFLELFGFYNKIIIDNNFINWIKDFKPEYIYIVPYTYKDIYFINKMIKIFNIPIIMHIYDDWIYHNRNGIFNFIIGPISRYKFSKLYKKTSINLCISEKMSEVYEKRYGKKSYTFHNPVNLNIWNINKQINYQKDIFNIVFIGTVGEHNFKEIMLLIQVVNKIPHNIVINLYGSIRKKYLYDELLKEKNININGLIDHDDVPNVLNQADILFLPMSFNKKQRNYIRYSMPTKFTEYLATQKPILVFAPRNFAITEYVIKYDCAYLVSEFNENLLYNVLSNIMENKDDKKIKNAINLVQKKHTIETVQKKFIDLILDKQI
jgi:hypothetical protein